MSCVVRTDSKQHNECATDHTHTRLWGAAAALLFFFFLIGRGLVLCFVSQLHSHRRAFAFYVSKVREGKTGGKRETRRWGRRYCRVAVLHERGGEANIHRLEGTASSVPKRRCTPHALFFCALMCACHGDSEQQKDTRQYTNYPGWSFVLLPRVTRRVCLRPRLETLPLAWRLLGA